MSDEKDLEIDSGDSDISFDDISGDALEKVRKLKQKLKDVQKDKEEYLSGWQRCKADFVNAKKADERERQNFIDFTNESFLRDLLPVLDSFNAALAIKEGDAGPDAMIGAGPDAMIGAGWREGFLGIYSKLMEALSRRGLKQIGNVGDKFSVQEYEPVGVVPVSDESLDETVTEVLQAGYSVNGRVIRPAKVRIGQYDDKIKN